MHQILTAAAEFDVVAWATTGFSLNSIIQALGLVSLALLFASDRIITKGQHMRRIGDLNAAHAAEITALKTHHTELVTEKDAHYGEMKESRDYYRQARLEERDRAENVTDALAELAGEYAKVTNHLLESLPKPKGSDS
jgi:hypothetical protein